MSKSYTEAKTLKFNYWKNKPVMHLTDKVYTSNSIKSKSEIETKYKKDIDTVIPPGYRWDKIDANDTEKMTHISSFLTEHYKRGGDSDYIIPYNPE